MTAPLRTARLLLRRWREEDLAPFAALNADPVVMEHLPAPLTRAQSDALVARTEACFEERGWGLWAVEEGGSFVGFTGLSVPPPALGLAPAVEVGWRLARSAWGRGVATEAATAALAEGLARGLTDVVSFTAVTNGRSQRVMERLGMAREREFDHPALPAGHRLRPHVLYRLARSSA